MKRIVASFTLLLFMHTATIAKAEELEENLARNDKAERVKFLLMSVGLTHPMFEETVAYVDKNIENDYFYFSQEKYENYSYGLRHEVGSPKLERLQLYFKPENSNYIYTVSTQEIKVNYHVEFDW